ncbi:MAG: T9SS type A sorting domain-containing protein [candidate division Zixibacteria bacterium]|nr:T9SS type A sorting domain-containing protein [candidate division Zixibacteria bacterium]
MRKILFVFVLASLFICTGASADTVLYLEDFDSGMGAWSGGWGISTINYHSAPNSMADSPTGNYGSNEFNEVELTTDIDLSGYPGARVQFWTKYDLENGFDSVYFDISTDGGTNWQRIKKYNGEGVNWYISSVDIGGFVGQSVRFRFILDSDGAYEVDGMYVDDFAVVGEDTDTSPPLIITDGATDSTFAPEEFQTMATITDFSGVDDAYIVYWVDGGTTNTIYPDSIVGDNYYWTIPEQAPGAHINYYIEAVDGASTPNTGQTDEFHYMAGWMLYYDDGDPEYIYIFASGDQAATRFTPESGRTANLVTGMLRFYTDPNYGLDSVDVNVWENSGGYPGASVITPFAVWPAATIQNPQAWTYVDFRGMGVDFDTDFFFGFTYRDSLPVILGDSPAVYNRTKVNVGGAGWADATTDLHIRAVVGYADLPPFDLDCDLTIRTPDVPCNGDIAFDLSVTNTGSSTYPSVIGELEPTIGDCVNGSVFDFNLTKTLTSNLEPGETFVGRYFYPVGDVCALGLTNVALTVEVGGAVNNYQGVCCEEFTFYSPWGRTDGNAQWGNEWFERGDGDVNMPQATSLGQNYPNPFNANTTIPFNLKTSGQATLKVYNLAGQLVETLVDGHMEAGQHTISWDASTLASGIYYYRLDTAEKHLIQRMTLVK